MATVHGPVQDKASSGPTSRPSSKPSSGGHGPAPGPAGPAGDPPPEGGAVHGGSPLPPGPPGSLPPDWNPYTGPYHHDDISDGSATGRGGHGSHAGEGSAHDRHGDQRADGHRDDRSHGHDHRHGHDDGHGHKAPHGLPPPGRRGLRQRVRRRLHPFRSAIKGFVIGLTLGLIALGAALATGLLDPQPILQALRGGDDPAAGVQDDIGREVITACAATLARTDCGCFWGQTRAVWSKGNVGEVMQALTERNRYAGQITRVKLDRLIGEDANRQVMQALIQCLQ